MGLTLMLFYYQLTDTILFLPFFNNFLLLSLFFFAVQYFIEGKYQIKIVGIFLTFFTIFAFQYKLAHDSRILVYIIALLGLKNIPVKKIVKIILFEKIGLIVSIATITAIGVGFVSKSREYVLGFIHGNLFMINVIEIFLLYIFLYWRRMNFFSNILVSFLIILTFYISESRTGLVLFFLSFFLYLQIKYGKIKHLKYLNEITIIAPSILFLMSISIPYLMNINWFNKYPLLNALIRKMDVLLTNRLTLSAIRLKNTEFHLLFSSTNSTQMNMYHYTVVDSGYVQLFLVFGVLGSILFLFYYTNLIHIISKMDFLGKDKYFYLLAILIMCLNAFTENSLCSLKYNFTLLFVLLINKERTRLYVKNIIKQLKIRGT